MVLLVKHLSLLDILELRLRAGLQQGLLVFLLPMDLHQTLSLYKRRQQGGAHRALSGWTLWFGLALRKDLLIVRAPQAKPVVLSYTFHN